MGLGHQTISRSIFSEINITPLTDIFLVLLIIMMVVAPMVHQTRPDIEPPELETGHTAQVPITVEITRDGSYFVNSYQTQETGLTEDLQAQLEKLPEGDEKNLMIRADKATKSSYVLAVLEAARNAGFEKVTVAGEPLDKKRQQQLQQTLPTEEVTG